jgi:hypothetical protein
MFLLDKLLQRISSLGTFKNQLQKSQIYDNLTEKNLLLGMTQMKPTPWVLQSKEEVAMPSIWGQRYKKFNVRNLQMFIKS